MLARINKHIPKASALLMVILFLMTNISPCLVTSYYIEDRRKPDLPPSKSLQF